MVFYKESFASIAEAVKQTDAVAVLGVFLKAGKHNNEFDRWLRNFGSSKLDDCGSFLYFHSIDRTRSIYCTHVQ